tara:strand:- start:1050 stop:1532 length:483 start_codon:yes stop_codon:yes gene_type:complete
MTPEYVRNKLNVWGGINAIYLAEYDDQREKLEAALRQFPIDSVLHLDVRSSPAPTIDLYIGIDMIGASLNVSVIPTTPDYWIRGSDHSEVESEVVRTSYHHDFTRIFIVEKWVEGKRGAAGLNHNLTIYRDADAYNATNLNTKSRPDRQIDLDAIIASLN